MKRKREVAPETTDTLIPTPDASITDPLSAGSTTASAATPASPPTATSNVPMTSYEGSDKLNASDIDALDHAMVTLSKAFQTVLNICPELCNIAEEELDPRLMLARQIKLAYQFEGIPLVDRIISTTMSTPASNHVPSTYLLGLGRDSLANRGTSAVKSQNGSAETAEEPPSSKKTWPPPLPKIYDKKLEVQVFTHKSVANQKQYLTQPELLRKHNERLEFIGDAVLNFIVSNIVYEKFPDVAEGDLTRIRALFVCNDTLWEWAKMYGLEKKLHIGFDRLAESQGKKSKIVSDTMEAYIGGLYLDSEQGPLVVREFLDELLTPLIATAIKERQDTEPLDKEAKQQLYVQIGSKDLTPEYITVVEGDNLTPFTVECRVEDKVIGVGTDANIKTAGIRAAMMALKNRDVIEKYSDLRRRTPRTEPRDDSPPANSTPTSRRISVIPTNSGPKDALYSVVGSAVHRPMYTTLNYNGIFKSVVRMDNDELGSGQGKTKKEAEMNAANQALGNERLLSKWIQLKKRVP